MLFLLLVLQGLTLVLVVVLWLRRSHRAAEQPDPRWEQLLAAGLAGQFTRWEALTAATDAQWRGELSQLRQELRAEHLRSHEAAESAGVGLRREVLGSISTLGDTLRNGLHGFRGDHRADAEVLRATVEGRLDKLNEVNAAKLEEMRATVDEKLHATLQTRLTESFGQVTDQLTKVHSGLGEMTKLSAGVDDLQRIFTNVRARGGFAEVQLGTLLAQTLAPRQFAANVRVKPDSAEVVEFCVKLPTPEGEAYLPIDAKFPREAWERLEGAYSRASAGEIAAAGRTFEAAIRTEGKRICEKYIAPPHTTSFAIMFLPTEGLYAEVMRRDGLQAEIQTGCHVTIAGPSTLSAILNSFQMGFHMLQLQQKGDEVWKVLASARTQFGKFEDLMARMEKQVDTVQNTIRDVGTRSRAIHRTLREVGTEAEDEKLGTDGSSTERRPSMFAEELPRIAAAAERPRGIEL